MDFVCPKCGGKLTELSGIKKCPLGHSFDRAKEGYYNLLLGAGGGVHGDNREMLEARRRFLGAGHYEPLCRLLGDRLLPVLPVGGCALDAGCGEGYYTDAIEKRAFERDGVSNILALDISRDGVRIASKRNRRVSFAVASSYAMPIESSSLDVVLNVFSPMAEDEVFRVLKPDGKFILVYPDTHHLWELKTAIYDNPYENKTELSAPRGFSLLTSDSLKYTVELNQGQIADLFLMTPYAYRTGERDREKLAKLDSLTIRVEFCIDVYEKRKD